MSSISNMFVNLNYLTKDLPNTNNQNTNNQNTNNDTAIFPALKQGNKFKKYQKNIKKSLEGDAIELSGIEGFEGINLNKLNLDADGLTKQSNNIVTKNDFSSGNQQTAITNLRQQYNNTLKDYEKLIAQINGSTTGYLDRINPNNPFLGKNIYFTTGETAYVTQQGVVKLYPKNEFGIPDVLLGTVGKNGCPMGQNSPINLPWLPMYSDPGVTIPSKPPLVTGTPMVKGQSCGSEGKNIFVNTLINEPKPTYKGCYADNPTNHLMTFIGGEPPLPSGNLQNGDFSQPQIANNSYQYISSGSTVPGWNFIAVLINNSSAWGYPMPYPSGSQAACIQGKQTIAQFIQLSSGSYTVTFYVCGRPGYKGGNRINMFCFPGGERNQLFVVNPSLIWQKYTTTFNLENSTTYIFGFEGLNTDGDFSTAIQNITLTQTSQGSASGNGSYTYEQCQKAAINGGYRYFALQNVNTTTSKGYCAVSNDDPTITRLGQSITPSGQLALWSSNTTNQTGNTASLTNQGALSVLNSGGQSIFSTPNSEAQPSSYLGCYGDGPNRALQIYNNGSQQYNLQECKQLAKTNGAGYFGLQNSTTGKNAQCTFGNDFSQATKYGKAGNCTRLSNGIWSGGGWSNAVYSTNNPSSNYFLMLQDDGNMVVCRGTSPTDNQGVIWTTGTNGKQQQANPNYAAAKGKYGKNWITQGSTLAAGDFVGSTNGNLTLIMQSDGNLVLYTFTMSSNCQKMSDQHFGGGVNGNAVYDVGQVGFKSNMGKVAYVDENSKLYPYPSDNVQYNINYTKISGANSSGYDIPGAAYGNATVEKCKTSCNNNSKCAGFSYDNTNNVCNPKSSGMYPNGDIQILNGSDIYLREKNPITPPIGVTNNINNIDSVIYQNYINGGEIKNSYGLANANTVQKQQLAQLQTKMNLITSQISNLTTVFGTGTTASENQTKKNVQGLDNYLTTLNNTNKKITSYTSNLDNILDDSDIVVLQKNYDYLFWTILATGTVLVSMNLVKK